MQIGSWVLTGFGLIAVLLVGMGSIYGPMVGMAAQPFWIAYGSATHQEGFVAWGISFFLVYSIALILKLRARRKPTCEMCGKPR
jgi:hypothetical protein